MPEKKPEIVKKPLFEIELETAKALKEVISLKKKK